MSDPVTLSRAHLDDLLYALRRCGVCRSPATREVLDGQWPWWCCDTCADGDGRDLPHAAAVRAALTALGAK